MKHTLGLWNYRKAELGYSIGCEPIEGEWKGKTIPIAFTQWDNHEANAKLIAAAPDLLAACKNSLVDGDEYHAMEIIKRAIKLAEEGSHA